MRPGALGDGGDGARTLAHGRSHGLHRRPCPAAARAPFTGRQADGEDGQHDSQQGGDRQRNRWPNRSQHACAHRGARGRECPAQRTARPGSGRPSDGRQGRGQCGTQHRQAGHQRQRPAQQMRTAAHRHTHRPAQPSQRYQRRGDAKPLQQDIRSPRPTQPQRVAGRTRRGGVQRRVMRIIGQQRQHKQQRRPAQRKRRELAHPQSDDAADFGGGKTLWGGEGHRTNRLIWTLSYSRYRARTKRKGPRHVPRPPICEGRR